MNYKTTALFTASLSTVSTCLFFSMIKNNKIVMIDWVMIKILCLTINFKLIIDFNAMIFTSTVLMITSSIIIYSDYYMKHKMLATKFLKMIMIFILAMIMLIFSANIPSMVLSWEGLGMSSFILIMFYKNNKSLTSAVLTMMINRMGDIMLIMATLYFMNLNSWSFETFHSNLMQPKEPIMFLMTAMFSKSAQLPFSSWLTEAMAAPTPVSALVHSSTLVTAGIYMTIRFKSTVVQMKFTKTIAIISVITMIMASMNSITEWDIKKTVALSTLIQMSMMFYSIHLELFKLSMLHLVLHATFKALIFLSTSTLINLFNTQDMRKMSMINKQFMVTQTAFNFANLSMCGFPFMSGAYSKEIIMESMNNNLSSMMTSIMFMISMTCSIFYSMKMMFSVNNYSTTKSLIKMSETPQQKTSAMMLIIPSITLGNKMNWMINMEHAIPMVSNVQKSHPSAIMMMSMAMISMMMMKSNKVKNTPITSVMMNYMMFSKNFSIQTKNKMLLFYLTNMKTSEQGTTEHVIKSMVKTCKKMTKKMIMMTSTNMKTLILMAITMTTLIKI